MARMVVCEDCGQLGPHKAKGLCQKCYRHKQNRRYYIAHHAELIEYKRRDYAEHQEERLERQRRYYTANREDRIEYTSRWRKAHPERSAKIIREQRRRRSARLNGATIMPVDEATIYELYGHRCIYCGATDDLTLDHVVPLAKGGAHSEDNLVVACKSCNSSKQDKELKRWLEAQPYSQAWVM